MFKLEIKITSDAQLKQVIKNMKKQGKESLVKHVEDMLKKAA